MASMVHARPFVPALPAGVPGAEPISGTSVTLRVVAIGPVTPETGPILLGEDLKDLGAAAARRLVEALGGSLSLEGERLLVRLPT